MLTRSSPNHSLDTIKGLTDPDKTAIKAAHIDCVEDFLAKMAENPRFIDSLIFLDNDAKRRLLDAISQFAIEKADSIPKHPLVLHIPDVLVLFAFVLVIYSLFWLDRTAVNPEMSKQVVVRTPSGLIPFHVINESDVEIRDSAKHVSAIRSVPDVIGRYPTEHIAEGSVIDQSRLSSGPRLSKELDGLRVFTLKLESSPLLVNLKLPAKMGIVPSSRIKDAGNELKIYEVYILEMHPQSDGISAVVATTTGDCLKLVSLLGHADLIPVRVVN